MNIATAESSRAAASPAQALAGLLDELSSVIIEVPDYAYRAAVEGVSGSIGEHVRHCLDHVSALMSARPSGVLSYDHRQRGTAIEMQPAAALQQMLRLKAALDRWPARSLDDPIRVESMLNRAGGDVTGWSTLARELAFVVSHTIHHQAIIALLLVIHGIDAPDRFGHSPSTPHRN